MKRLPLLVLLLIICGCGQTEPAAPERKDVKTMCHEVLVKNMKVIARDSNDGDQPYLNFAAPVEVMLTGDPEPLPDGYAVYARVDGVGKGGEKVAREIGAHIATKVELTRDTARQFGRKTEFKLEMVTGDLATFKRQVEFKRAEKKD